MEYLPLITAITQAGSFGLLTYMAIWGFPQMLREFRQEREKMATECQQERTAAREDYAKQVADERSDCTARFDKILLHLGKG